ncbi:MAG: hypothetical protein QNK15_01950, partial [Cycloclasticus sp.]|nr:hypothetical protein [Cycloclasticus sp.]
MKLINVLPFFTLVCSMSTFATGQKAINESDLYGNWNCKHEVVDSNTKMKAKINYYVNFVRAGKSNGFGTLLFKLPNFPELKYSLTGNSTWNIKDGHLLLSSTEIKSVNVSHPELDQFLNVKQFIPKRISESSKILKLTKSSLEVKSQSN